MKTAINKYLGWANQETMLINLWLLSAGAEDVYFGLVQTIKSNEDKFAQAEWLERAVYDELEQVEQSMGFCIWRDLLLASLERINWLQLVENYKD